MPLTAGFDWIGGDIPDGYADCVDTNQLIYPGLWKRVTVYLTVQIQITVLPSA